VTELNAVDGNYVKLLKGGNYGFRLPNAMAVGGGAIWVANASTSGGKSVTVISATNGAWLHTSDGSWLRTLLARRYHFNYPVAVAVRAGHVWVANADGNSVTELPTG